MRPHLSLPLFRARMLLFATASSLLSALALCLAGAALVEKEASHATFLTGLVGAALCLAIVALLFVKTDRSLRRTEQRNATVEDRAQAVHLLLDFTQTLQAAAKAEQVLNTLCHALRKALPLSGVAVLSHESDSIPPTTLKMTLPPQLLATEASCSEFDASMCPCLRQKQSRHFRADDSPVRCPIDGLILLPPTHAAFCVPMQVGPRIQLTAHMLLPPGREWTEEWRQLAQTYVHAAQSSLISLQLLQEAEQRSMTDALTGLYNRRSMEQLLQREVALAERYRHPLSLVMIDLDLFKQINDAHGHAAGDHLLRCFADCVRMTLRKTDLAFRYGGDEFVIVLPQTPVSQAQQVVSKVRQAFAAVDFSSAIAHLERQPTLSIGVVERSVQHNILNLQSLLAAADQALYEAKNASRNCVKTYQPPQAA